MAKAKSDPEIDAMVSGSGFIAAVWTEFLTLVRERGGTGRDVHRLATPEGRPLLAQFADLIVGVAKAAIYPFTYKFPWWNDKCKVEREGTPSPTPLDFTKLEAVPFHKEGENFVSGGEMLRRASDPVAFPGCQGWGMHQGGELHERRAEIPEAMRGFALLLPDTILLVENGLRCIACLFWCGGEWQFRYDWIGGRFNRRFQFVRLSK